MNDVVHEIDGHGQFVKANQDINSRATFNLRQLASGKMYLECKSDQPGMDYFLDLAEGFEGNSKDGTRVTVSGLFHRGPGLRFLVAEASIGEPPTNDTESFRHRYCLTSMVHEERERANKLIFPTDPVPTQAELAPRNDYAMRKRQAVDERLVVPTAALEFRCLTQSCDELAQTFCDSLSIAQGNRVTWIARETLDNNSSDSLVQSRWIDGKIKRVSNLGPDQFGGGRRRLAIASAPACYRRLLELNHLYQWRGQVLEAWLESRFSDIFTEARSLQLITVIDAIRSAVVNKGASGFSPPVPEKIWDQLQRELRKHARRRLRSLGRPLREADFVSRPEAWRLLNRRSFRSELKEVLDVLGVAVSSQELNFFIGSRNSLIHEGIFLSRGKRDRPTGFAKDVTQEYLFLAGFVDRIILSMLGLQEYLEAARR